MADLTTRANAVKQYYQSQIDSFVAGDGYKSKKKPDFFNVNIHTSHEWDTGEDAYYLIRITYLNNSRGQQYIALVHILLNVGNNGSSTYNRPSLDEHTLMPRIDYYNKSYGDGAGTIMNFTFPIVDLSKIHDVSDASQVIEYVVSGRHYKSLHERVNNISGMFILGDFVIQPNFCKWESTTNSMITATRVKRTVLDCAYHLFKQGARDNLFECMDLQSTIPLIHSLIRNNNSFSGLHQLYINALNKNNSIYQNILKQANIDNISFKVAAMALSMTQFKFLVAVNDSIGKSPIFITALFAMRKYDKFSLQLAKRAKDMGIVAVADSTINNEDDLFIRVVIISLLMTGVYDMYKRHAIELVVIPGIPHTMGESISKNGASKSLLFYDVLVKEFKNTVMYGKMVSLYTDIINYSKFY